MSIISEALKKAEKEREKTIASKEYLNKILGPERKATYKREEFKTDKSQLQPKVLPSETEITESQNARYIRSKILIASGILLLLTIIFLTVINILLVPSPDIKVATSGRTSGFTEVPVEAEAYTDVRPEVALVDDKAGFIDKTARVLRNDIQEEFLSNFTLNGIVYDAEDSWAIINNEVVGVGDTLRGARVISIAPQKIVLLFKNKRFDLAVK